MIFLSYRRDDTSFQVTTFANLLTDLYGEEAVFVDDEIRIGQDWPDRLRQELHKRQIVLALVGRNWNPKRLHDPGDWVRAEICTGLRMGSDQLLVLLLDGATLPAATDLPQDCDLPQLPSRQQLLFRSRPRKDFDADFETLCDRLKELCPALGRRDVPEACVRALRGFLRTPDDRERVLENAFYPTHMHLACLPVSGGTLENLSRTIRELERCEESGDGCPWPLLRYLEAVKEHFCEPAQRPELTQLQIRWLESRFPACNFAHQLDRLTSALGAHADQPRPELEADFRACPLGGFPSGLPETLKTPRVYAAVLAGRQHGDEPEESVPSPLLTFARRIQNRFPECRAALEQWETDATDFLTVHYDVPVIVDETRPASPVAPAAEARPAVSTEVDAWLTVLVRPTRPGGLDYAVRGWLFHRGAPAGETLLRGESPIVRAAGLPACLRELRRDAIRARNGGDTFQVELVVPPALRNRPFGDWPLSDPTGRAWTFGQEHPVVVRCLRRIADRNSLGRLRRRWNLVRQNSEGPPLTENLSPGARGVFRVPAGFRAEELRARLADCPGIVGVVFARPAAECRRAIDAAVEAGVPLVAWCRPACHADPTPFIRSADPITLARDLLARPISAPAGSGFVVLLDDPARLPPDLDSVHRLRPPTRTDCHE